MPIISVRTLGFYFLIQLRNAPFFRLFILSRAQGIQKKNIIFLYDVIMTSSIFEKLAIFSTNPNPQFLR